MKKVVASIGLVALGAWSLHAAELADARAGADQPFHASATLRGFYDDNINTFPNGTNRLDTFGFEVAPSISKVWSLEQTTARLSYDYSLLYYDRRPVNNTDNYDQTHSFNATVDHAFSPRYL